MIQTVDGSVLVSDLKSAGLIPTVCSLDDVEVYLVTDKLILLQVGCGEMGGGMWAYDMETKKISKRKINLASGTENPSPDNRYQVILNTEDKDGEVRSLVFKDFIEDQEFIGNELPTSLSYKSGISDFDGRPVGSIKWNSPDTAYAEVYDAKIPIIDYDRRQPVLLKFVTR